METLFVFWMYNCKSRYVEQIYKMLLEIELFKKKKEKKERKGKKIKIALSLGYPNSYFYNKRCNMLLYWWPHLSFFWLHKVAFFNQCQCHSSCLRTWHGAFVGENAKGAHGEIYKFPISVISTNFFDQVQIFLLFLRIALLLRLDSKPAVNSRTYRHFGLD